jgi:hypothetical protein
LSTRELTTQSAMTDLAQRGLIRLCGARTMEIVDCEALTEGDDPSAHVDTQNGGRLLSSER